MKIRNNLIGLNTLNNLNKQNKKLEKSTSRLASGLRVAGSADDAAGLSISEKMRSQIRGLRIASRNARDAHSYMQSKEGALDEVHDMMHRMRELTIQSLNDTLTDEDRFQIQQEFRALQLAIDDITSQSEFNTKPLFDAHQASFYQFGGNQSFDGLVHIVDGINNDLIVSIDNQIVQVTIDEGHYPPRELADLLDSKLMEAYPNLIINLTEQEHFTLQAEGNQTIDYIKGGLSFLFYEYVIGNPPGMIIGVTEFQENGRLHIQPGHNDRLTFLLGSNKEYTINFAFKPGGYTMDELIDTINTQLNAKGENDVKAIKYSNKHIALTSDKFVITGLSGNMIKLDGINSVLYDNAKYGVVSKTRGYVEGRRDLASGVLIERDTNDTLRFWLDGSEDPIEINLLEPADSSKELNVHELVAKLNSEFDAQGIEAVAETGLYSSTRLRISSNYFGSASQIRLDPTSSAYEDLFVNRTQHLRQPTVTPGAEATIKGYSSLDTITRIRTGINDTLDFTLDGTSYSITLDKGRYSRSELVSHINALLEQNTINALAHLENTGLFLVNNRKGGGTISVSPESNAYRTLFQATSYPYPSTFVQPGTTTWPPEGVVGDPISETPATVTGRADLTDTLILIDELNNSLEFSINGEKHGISLEQGYYSSADDLVTMIAKNIEHLDINVSLQDGKHLRFETTGVGEDQSLTVTGTASTMLLAAKSYATITNSASAIPYSIRGELIIGSNFTVDEENNDLVFTYHDGDSTHTISLELTTGINYNATTLAEELNVKIQEQLARLDLPSDTISANTIGGNLRIRTKGVGSDFQLTLFSGGLYDSAFRRIVTTVYNPLNTSGTSTEREDEIAYLVGREDLVENVIIHPYVNDVLVFDFQNGGFKETFELRLNSGNYSPDALVSEIQSKLSEQLVAKGLEPNLLTVQIGGVNSGTSEDDHNKLVIKHVPVNDGRNNNGTYIIDGMRGNAAYTVFYKSQGDPIPTHTVGAVDLSNGARIQAGVNDTLTMDINGEPASITLDPGDHPPENLLTAFNEKLKEQSLGLVASYFDGRLKLSFEESGMNTIEAIRGNAKGTLFFEVNSRIAQNKEHFQIGANSGEALIADHSRVSTELLRINTVMIHKTESASKALTRLDEAISLVSGERGRLGALQNRLDVIIQNNEVYRENLMAAESRIRDADMALEVMEQVKSSMLQQSASAMLVQANLAPQVVLQLLR